MSAGFLIRTVIVIPIIWLLLFMFQIVFQVLDPIYSLTSSNAAVGSLGWGGAAQSGMLILTISVAAYGLGLIMWLILGNLKNDTFVGRRY